MLKALTEEEIQRLSSARERELRDRFAAESLAGVIAFAAAATTPQDLNGADLARWIAATAWSIADAMMAERGRTA